MSNSWVQRVNNYAQEHNLSYACALTDPGRKNSYTKIIWKRIKNKNDGTSFRYYSQKNKGR